ncbi:MAG: AI-2E family transporter [Anaerolineae bacterium]|jgi:predicted PurR-regulated permease PerM|nr:AI-2E family transporter [Anaerolineae bacterium]
MQPTRLLRVTLSLGAVALLIFIVINVWQFGQTLGQLLSTLAGAWLLSLILRPMIFRLRTGVVPSAALIWARGRFGDATVKRLAGLRLPFGLAVALVYLLTVAIIFGGSVVAIAAILPQATALVNQAPQIAAALPDQISALWVPFAQRVGLDANLITQFVSGQDFTARLGQVAGIVAQQAVSIATATANFIGQVILILILSLYITNEGKLIERQFFALLPASGHKTFEAAFKAVGESFGGYLRSTVVVMLIGGVSTVLIFTVLGLPFGVAVGAIFGVLSIIPLVGAPVGVLIAVVVALFVKPEVAIWVGVTTLVFNQIVAYWISPKLMQDTVGVPGLVGLVAVALGVQLIGFWGLIFGVPVAGAAYALLFDFWLPRRRVKQGLPERDPQLEEVLGRKRKGPPLVAHEPLPVGTVGQPTPGPEAPLPLAPAPEPSAPVGRPTPGPEAPPIV